ncbi:MAG: hypothetical protein QNJ97_02800 [Myxococcota bacterium]|nr:hypothetical protein [Myxococcota bacterium]
MALQSRHIGDELTAWALALGAFLLPFWGIGHFNLQDSGLPILPVDTCLIVAAIFQITAAWRLKTQIIKNPINVAVLGIAVSHVIAGLLSEDPFEELRTIARQFVFVGCVVAIFTLERSGKKSSVQRVWQGFIIGGVIALKLSLLGYLFMLSGGGFQDGVNPFVFTSTNPLFDRWPRLSGTFGHSPQYLGQYAVALLAVMLAYYTKGDARIGIWKWLTVALTGVCLILTFSWAWIGGAIILAGFLIQRYHLAALWRTSIIAAVVIGTLAATWIMNIGLPFPIEQRQEMDPIPCAAFDTWHRVNAEYDGEPKMCQPMAAFWPYERLQTTYLYAKRTAVEIAWENRWTGIGFRQYATAANDRFHRDFRTQNGTHYETPHCDTLRAVATAGLFGLSAFLFYVVVILTWNPYRHNGPASYLYLWLGLIGFLVLGINVDVMHQRYLFFIIGFFSSQPSIDRGLRGS